MRTVDKDPTTRQAAPHPSDQRRAEKMHNIKSDVDRQIYQMVLVHNVGAEPRMRVPSDSDQETLEGPESDLELENELKVLEGRGGRKQSEDPGQKRKAVAR